MSADSEIHLTIDKKEIRRVLRNYLITSPFPDIIADVIISNLGETQIGLVQLCRAFSGIAPSSRFKPFDQVLVKWQGLSTWRCDEKIMKEKGLLHQGYCNAEIVEIDLIKSYSVCIKYDYYDNAGVLNTDPYHWTGEQYIEFKPDNVIE